MTAFEEYWEECLSLAGSYNQIEIMFKLKNLYEDAFDEGKTPEQVMEEEWG